MNIIGEWLKKVVFSMCFLELIYQLVPKKPWQNYLKFTGGLVFMLIFLEPVLQIFSMTEKFDNAAWNWQMQERSAQLKEEQKALAELQNEQIRLGTCRELEHQVAQLIKNMGGEPDTVLVTLQAETEEKIERVEIVLEKEMEQKDLCRKQIQVYLGLTESQIVIRSKMGGRSSR